LLVEFKNPFPQFNSHSFEKRDRGEKISSRFFFERITVKVKIKGGEK
jgi:hypothetical protein